MRKTEDVLLWCIIFVPLQGEASDLAHSLKVFFGTRDFASDLAVFINSYKSLFMQKNRDFVVLSCQTPEKVFSPC